MPGPRDSEEITDEQVNNLVQEEPYEELIEDFQVTADDFTHFAQATNYKQNELTGVHYLSYLLESQVEGVDELVVDELLDRVEREGLKESETEEGFQSLFLDFVTLIAKFKSEPRRRKRLILKFLGICNKFLCLTHGVIRRRLKSIRKYIRNIISHMTSSPFKTLFPRALEDDSGPSLTSTMTSLPSETQFPRALGDDRGLSSTKIIRIFSAVKKITTDIDKLRNKRSMFERFHKIDSISPKDLHDFLTELFKEKEIKKDYCEFMKTLENIKISITQRIDHGQSGVKTGINKRISDVHTDHDTYFKSVTKENQAKKICYEQSELFSVSVVSKAKVRSSVYLENSEVKSVQEMLEILQNNGVLLLDKQVISELCLNSRTFFIIRLDIVSQWMLHPYLLTLLTNSDRNNNQAVENIFALRRRRKHRHHGGYWMVSEEVFINAIRLTVTIRDLYYTVIYPTDSRMNLYLPVFAGGFIHEKDVLDDRIPSNDLFDYVSTSPSLQDQNADDVSRLTDHYNRPFMS